MRTASRSAARKEAEANCSTTSGRPVLGAACVTDEIAVWREAANGQFESGNFGGLAGFEVAGGHGELVEVGEQSVHVQAGQAATACPT